MQASRGTSKGMSMCSSASSNVIQRTLIHAAFPHSGASQSQQRIFQLHRERSGTANVEIWRTSSSVVSGLSATISARPTSV
jgi:hypothetical protein